ncbi:MAG: aminotransferase class I/II-fold pyridoxal phosphate-dependent enzyme [Minicystis sp.]
MSNPLAGLAPATLAAQALHAIDAETRAVVPPIHTATTYARDAAYQLAGPCYTRDENPTYRFAEALLARLEGGAEALLFSSGLSAATTATQAVLAPGDRLVASRAMYFGLRVWMEAWCRRWQIDLRLVDATDLAAVRAALDGRARLLWIETPANPTWDVVDIAACADLAHEAGAILGVDSTVATPVHTRPLALGADLVMHSATKALNGHGDVLAGALVTRATDAPFWPAIRALRHDQGAVPGPFEAFLLLRGMRTLYLRVPRQSATALAIATRLHGHPKLEAVLYPGLPTHPGHAIAARQMEGGFGGLLSIRVRGGAEAALAVVSRLRVWMPATSLGGVESLVEHRFTAEGPATLAPPDLLRLSVGIEEPRDLIDDLLQALE